MEAYFFINYSLDDGGRANNSTSVKCWDDQWAAGSTQTALREEQKLATSTWKMSVVFVGISRGNTSGRLCLVVDFCARLFNPPK